MSGRTSGLNRFPGDFAATLRLRHTIIQAIRRFFDTRGYIEVETPLRVPCPCIDIYIDAFPAGASLFLSTSPEFHMKRLLRLDIQRIYQITRAFRAEEAGRHHSAEFTMLESRYVAPHYVNADAYVLLILSTDSAIPSFATETIPSPSHRNTLLALMDNSTLSRLTTKSSYRL